MLTPLPNRMAPIAFPNIVALLNTVALDALPHTEAPQNIATLLNVAALPSVPAFPSVLALLKTVTLLNVVAWSVQNLQNLGVGQLHETGTQFLCLLRLLALLSAVILLDSEALLVLLNIVA